MNSIQKEFIFIVMLPDSNIKKTTTQPLTFLNMFKEYYNPESSENIFDFITYCIAMKYNRMNKNYRIT